MKHHITEILWMRCLSMDSQFCEAVVCCGGGGGGKDGSDLVGALSAVYLVGLGRGHRLYVSRASWRIMRQKNRSDGRSTSWTL